MNQHLPAEHFKNSTALDFLWLELTNSCNLECVHCYAKSSPRWKDKSPLSYEEYSKILVDTRKTGCAGVQFIGGEPTINKLLPDLICKASELGFSFIEVFTNLVALSDNLLSVFQEKHVSVATSVYSKRGTVFST